MEFLNLVSRTSLFPNLGVLGGIFIFFSNFKRTNCKQTVRYPLSDLGLHCLSMPHKENARLIWVKEIKYFVLTRVTLENSIPSWDTISPPLWGKIPIFCKWAGTRGIGESAWVFNPYTPSVIFVGHTQTVQTPQNAASDQGLHCFLTDCTIQRIQMTITTNNHKIGNGLAQLIKMGKSIRHKWVILKILVGYLSNICKNGVCAYAISLMYSGPCIVYTGITDITLIHN